MRNERKCMTCKHHLINPDRCCQQRSGGVTIKGRHPDGSPTDTPGPGAYDTPQRQGGGFSMAGRYSERPESGTPGPGAYIQGCVLFNVLGLSTFAGYVYFSCVDF